jgi:hypothetical protein
VIGSFPAKSEVFQSNLVSRRISWQICVSGAPPTGSTISRAGEAHGPEMRARPPLACRERLRYTEPYGSVYDDPT